MNILEKITHTKREEIRIRKRYKPVRVLESSEYFNEKIPSFRSALTSSRPAIIAEFKRKSPSKGAINLSAEVDDVLPGYIHSGAAAVSILTDEEYFGGSNNDLEAAACMSYIPLLRKDFVIDEYQIIEARAIGASAILLIASILKSEDVRNLSRLAADLGLDVLFEIHDTEDIDKLCNGISIIGVNNRNLGSFEVNIDNSSNLLRYLPSHCIKIAESGISSPDDVISLYKSGFDAFLIGENFMKHADPGKAATGFINAIRSGI